MSMFLESYLNNKYISNHEDITIWSDHNPHIGIKDTDDKPLIYNACYIGNIENIDYFIKKGANINRQSRSWHGDTALMLACSIGNIEIVNLLITNGANLDLQNYLGVTALMIAMYKENVVIAKMLIEHGANVDIKNINDETVVDIAKRYNNKELINLLLPRNEKIITIDNGIKMTFNRDQIESAIIPENINYNDGLIKEQCPISYEQIRIPIILNSGITYEMTSIKKWLDTNKKCPMTNIEFNWSIVNVNYLQYIITGDKSWLKNKNGEYFIDPVVCKNDGLTYEKRLDNDEYCNNYILKRVINNL